jgi:adrenodoxin-NADP+ reductase
VWWYNGHPDMCDLSPDLKNTQSAVVLGQGNVALDVARILLRCKTELATTDIADYALDALCGSTISSQFMLHVKEGILGWATGSSTGSLHSKGAA